MRQIKTLVFMQLKDKIDVSWIYSKKSRIHTIVLALLKFIAITVLYSAVLYLASYFGLVYYSEMPKITTLVITIALFLSTISCMVGLMNTLYFSEDNKVLITMPIPTNKIYISKLLVFFFYEIKRSFNFTIPLILACAINISLKGYLHFSSYFWMIIPLIFIVSLPVLLGAILSIPCMYVYRFLNKYPLIKGILALVVIVLFITGCIFLINLIPDHIDLINQWPDVRKAIINFLNNFENHFYLMKHLTRIIIGQRQANGIYHVDPWSILKIFILISIVVGLYFLNYFISRPIFFKMMAKNFEFNKSDNAEGINIKHNQIITFNLKEFKISLRSLDISINYLAIYILIPLLILLLDKVFSAMDKNKTGYLMSYAFNILLIVLPLLSSNSLIATLYSKEGRAGYIKKTKPVKPIVPLLAKLTFNIILSIPCVIASTIIFSRYASFNFITTLILLLAILLLHYGHMFYSATLDIMNPQNESYATSGEEVNNENENKSSIVAFLLSIAYSLIAFKLFSETKFYGGSVLPASIKLFLIAAILFAYFFVSFFLKIKAFYGEK